MATTSTQTDLHAQASGACSALRALRCSNLEEFDRVLYGACRALFGWSFAHFQERWRPLDPDNDRFTTRARVCPKVLALNEAWLEARDPTTLYSDPEYFLNSVAAGVSGTTPKNLAQGIKFVKELMGADPKRVLDFGPGCGLTSLALAASFPSAEVTWADVEGTNSQRLAQGLAHYAGLDDRISWGRRGDYDVVFALEVVEHLHGEEPGVGDPFSHPFEEVLSSCRRYLVYATQWRAELHGYLCPGHFLKYRIDGRLYHVKDAKRAFEFALEARGFRLSMKGWNGQPLVYSRIF